MFSLLERVRRSKESERLVRLAPVGHFRTAGRPAGLPLGRPSRASGRLAGPPAIGEIIVDRGNEAEEEAGNVGKKTRLARKGK